MMSFSELSIQEFNGADVGISPGACGLFAAIGKDVSFLALITAAELLQYRARNGAGITLKGIYEDNFFHFHIMYRKQDKISEYESILEDWGLHILDKEPMVKKHFYYKYDMPEMIAYTIAPPSECEIKAKQGYAVSPLSYIMKQTANFNLMFRNDVRIFSSGVDIGTFGTIYDLEDTIRVFNLEERFSDKKITGAMIHMRWPTSWGYGLWFGIQPISHGVWAGIHNGHLSSDKSNARALEEPGIPLQVGTDSEAMFQEMYYLIKKQYSLEEIEWIMAQKFPVEAEDFPDMKRGRYYELTTDPILRRFKMSGPSTASILIDNILIGITDRDHMRQFTVAWNDNVVIFASEEMAVLSSAYLMQEDVEIINPMPGQIIGFMLKDDKLERLSHTWRLEKKEKI